VLACSLVASLVADADAFICERRSRRLRFFRFGDVLCVSARFGSFQVLRLGLVWCCSRSIRRTFCTSFFIYMTASPLFGTLRVRTHHRAHAHFAASHGHLRFAPGDANGAATYTPKQWFYRFAAACALFLVPALPIFKTPALYSAGLLASRALNRRTFTAHALHARLMTDRRFKTRLGGLHYLWDFHGPRVYFMRSRCIRCLFTGGGAPWTAPFNSLFSEQNRGRPASPLSPIAACAVRATCARVFSIPPRTLAATGPLPLPPSLPVPHYLCMLTDRLDTPYFEGTPRWRCRFGTRGLPELPANALSAMPPPGPCGRCASAQVRALRVLVAFDLHWSACSLLFMRDNVVQTRFWRLTPSQTRCLLHDCLLCRFTAPRFRTPLRFGRDETHLHHLPRFLRRTLHYLLRHARDAARHAGAPW